MSNTDDRLTQKGTFINNTDKSGIRQLASDTVKISDLGAAQWEAGAFTVDFTASTNSARILTNIDFNKDYLIEVWLNDFSKAKDITMENDTGKLAFTINYAIYNDTSIRYTVYDRVVTQRQSLSKALRPQADN